MSANITFFNSFGMSSLKQQNTHKIYEPQRRTWPREFMVVPGVSCSSPWWLDESSLSRSTVSFIQATHTNREKMGFDNRGESGLLIYSTPIIPDQNYAIKYLRHHWSMASICCKWLQANLYTVTVTVTTWSMRVPRWSIVLVINTRFV